MNADMLSAYGLALDMLGVTLIYVFAIRRPPDHGENEAFGLLGYLALMDGLLLQLIASLELHRLNGT
jgi:hypothetical protein